MNVLRKNLIVFVAAFTVALLPIEILAHVVSAAGGCSVPNSHPDAKGFYDRIKSFPGWNGNFYKVDNGSKEVQYKRVSLGGQNNSWIDSSDIHYHISHGGTQWDSYYGKNLTAIIFEDGTRLVPSEARVAWGDSNLEWIGFRNCKLLNDASKAYWANAMNRLHLLLGFKTNSNKQDNFGKIWAYNMRQRYFFWFTLPSQTVMQAWFYATDATQPSGVTARVLAETYHNYSDHLWGNGYTSSDPIVDNWYWWWDHTAGSPPYLPVSTLSDMQVYRVVPRVVDDAYVKRIGTAFGLTGEVGQMCDSLVMADINDPANPKILEVSRTTGHFYFHNDGKLFVADMNVGQFPLIDAYPAAESFLSQYNLLPADALDYSVEFDTITEEDRNSGAIGQVLQQNTNVVWARHIPADFAGTMVSVAGAGARLKVYIAEDSSVMGAMGNWRDIESIEYIPVNDSFTTWSFFDTYGNKLAIEPVPVSYDQAIPDYNTATQLYYEYSSQTSQTELIPCWLFQVDYYLNQALVLTAETFIPAVERYFPPIVKIISPGESDIFNYGDTINFDCQVEPGFGSQPYTYKWESSVDGLLSTQPNFQTNLLSINCPDKSLDGNPLPHTISVTVTDAKGFQSTDVIHITVEGNCNEYTDPADLNGDRTVDLRDLAYWSSRYLTQSGYGE